MARKLQSDKVLFGTVAVLVLFGALMVYSASAVMAAERYGHSYYFLLRQLAWAAVGLSLMVAATNLDYRRLCSPLIVFPALAVELILLAAVLFTDRSHHVHRWFRLGPMNFQPSELTKLVLVLFLAYFLDLRRKSPNDLAYTLLPIALVSGVSLGLILKEPDLGTTLAIGMVASTMLLMAGVRWQYFAGLGLAAIPACYLLIWRVPYQRDRLLTFLNPYADPLGKGFQILQSYIAVGVGGIFGVGLMEGKQKLFYLPEPQTDFIFAVISEEWGFVGALAVLALFAVILWRGLRAAALCRDEFGRLLATGLTVMLVAQALINISVVVGLLPTKGIPLPFVSYGGSSLVINLLAVGILLNISQRAGQLAG
jgi:cell division protein FtsW